MPSHNPNNSSDFGKLIVYDATSLVNLLDETFTHENEEPNQGSVSWQRSEEQAGKCFIENLNLTRSTEIYIYFYSNFFSYTDGANRYYWFGDSDNVTLQYTIKLHVIDQIIIPNEDTAIIDEIDIYENSYIYYGTGDYFVSSVFDDYARSVDYKSISLSLFVTGVSCGTLTATINLKNVLSGTAYLMNFEGVENCTGSQLMADATIKLQNYHQEINIC